ncbi:hypothetical protein PGT21_022555 [Puccinia graminis f. sp. tritici]|uniref:Uncharacterized protein n=1 Tax=Puccinia graminis f. sp. tritici TaxID=56615 RepID=A0A5B0PUE3_PUCGR|nr:hypothetical protein PGTUg99_028908 [Puccinia graminis f. sp. tritici]KAA1104413.1 hypothetical protein PGT21_022555 [Puccinia graminis f. sp. tritici]
MVGQTVTDGLCWLGPCPIVPATPSLGLSHPNGQPPLRWLYQHQSQEFTRWCSPTPSQETGIDRTSEQRVCTSTISNVRYDKSHWTKCYNIVAVTDNNTIIVVKIQRASQPYHLDRVVHCSAQLISDYLRWKGCKPPHDIFRELTPGTLPQNQGRKKWDYKSNQVYVISICDFLWTQQPKIPELLNNKWLLRQTPHWELHLALPQDPQDKSNASSVRAEKPVAQFCFISLPNFCILTGDYVTLPLEKLLWIFANSGSKQGKRSLPGWAEKDPTACSFVEKLCYDCLSPAEKLAYDRAVDMEKQLEGDKAIEQERVAEQSELLAAERDIAKQERDLALKQIRHLKAVLKSLGADHPQQPDE